MKRISLVLFFIFTSTLMLKANVIEDEIVRLINLERSKKALEPLPVNQRLNNLALYHTDNMAKNKFLSNTDLDGLDTKGRQLKLYPEMVGTLVESFEKLDIIPLTEKNAANSIFQNLLSSPDNKKHILNNNFNAIGVGAVKSGVGVYVTVTYANIIAESVNFKPTAKEGEEIKVMYRILNKAPFTDFKIVVEMADPEAKIVGEDGKTYIGTVIYSVKDVGNTVVSASFKAEYGKGDYKVSLLYKDQHFKSNIRTITVK